MTDHVVIYDPNLEIGAIVDTDTLRAVGPIGVGPNAQGELTQFVERMPATVLTMSSYELARAYVEFWQDNFAALYESPAGGDAPALVEPDGAGNNAARLAEHEAVTGRGEPPPPQPADADLEADAGETTSVAGTSTTAADTESPPAEKVPDYEGPCFACNGSGLVPGATDGERVSCNLCRGTGQLPAPAAA